MTWVLWFIFGMLVYGFGAGYGFWRADSLTRELFKRKKLRPYFETASTIRHRLVTPLEQTEYARARLPAYELARNSTLVVVFAMISIFFSVFQSDLDPAESIIAPLICFLMAATATFMLTKKVNALTSIAGARWFRLSDNNPNMAHFPATAVPGKLLCRIEQPVTLWNKEDLKVIPLEDFAQPALIPAGVPLYWSFIDK